MREKWSDFLFHINWTSTENGFMNIYVNGNHKPAYRWTGRTKRHKFPDIYFKFGIYTYKKANKEFPTRVVYYDDVRKGKTCSEVTEYFPCDEIVAGARGS